jgi:hypothetical protein
MELKIASWNLCGMSKLRCYPRTAEWLFNHDIVLIQESLQVTQTFSVLDVTRFDVPATFTRGRASGGLMIALKNRKFGASRITVLVDEDYILALHIENPSSSCSLVVANIYAPVHSTGVDPEIIRTIQAQLESLAVQYPSATVIYAGDFNGHLFVPPERRSREDIYVYDLDKSMTDVGFARYPLTETPFTFRGVKSLSTIDYVYVRGAVVSGFEVAKLVPF